LVGNPGSWGLSASVARMSASTPSRGGASEVLGALTQGPVKPVLHAHYPADGWPTAHETLDYREQERDGGDELLPVFARDYDALMKRAEAALVHRADRELPELQFVSEGVRLLAQVVESTVLTARDLENPAGQVRLALAALGLVALRGARAFVLLVEPGYVPEAGVILNRMTSAVELARLVDDDEEGTVAERFIAGAGLDELDPDTWTNIAQAIAANIEQMPPLGMIQTPLGPRPGLGFAGNRQLAQARDLTVDVAFLLTDLTLICGKTLLGDTAPEPFATRLVALRAEVSSRMADDTSQSSEIAGEAEESSASG